MSESRLGNLKLTCECGQKLTGKRDGYTLTRIGKVVNFEQAILVCDICGRLYHFAATEAIGGVIASYKVAPEHYYYAFKNNDRNAWMRLMRNADFFRRTDREKRKPKDSL
jgi:hypothetical protein